jgi:hypothetical protein
MIKKICFLILIAVCMAVPYSMYPKNARAVEITCGVTCSSYQGAWNGGFTRLVYKNPVSATGTITRICCNNYAPVTNQYFGIFYLSGSKYYCRSAVSVGSATSGQHTYTVSLSCNSGDVIGWYCDGTNGFAYSVTESNKMGWKSGNYCVVGRNASFTNGQYIPAINGTGGNGGLAGVGSIDSVSIASISTVDGMAKIAIYSIDGVQ